MSKATNSPLGPRRSPPPLRRNAAGGFGNDAFCQCALIALRVADIGVPLNGGASDGRR